MKKLTFVLVLFLAVAVAMPAQANFPDVSEDHWAYEAVEELQAAGVIEGYPDGEFKGSQNMTRYEMALMIARMLDDLNMQLENLDGDLSSLSAEVGDMGSGLTADQADDVAAIVEAMLEEQLPEEDDEEGLTAEQSEQVVNLIRALTAEFNTELRMLREDLGAMEAFAEDNEDNRERIADLEDRMSDVETVQFSGSYSVDFLHRDTTLEDEDADFPATSTSGFSLPDVDLATLQTEGYADKAEWYTEVATDIRDLVENGTTTEPLTGTTVTIDNSDLSVYDSYEDHVETAVDEYNETLSDGGYSEFMIVKDTSESFALPGWEVPSGFTGFEQETGFSQLLELQLDITTDYFDAAIDLDIAGSQDEVSLDSAGLEIENDFLKGIYSTSNAVSMNKFAVDSETINGVTVEFKDWDVDTFFGELTETTGADESDQFIWDYDEDGELEDFDTIFTVDDANYEAAFEQGVDTSSTSRYYLMGANTNLSLADFDIRAGAAMRSDRYDFTSEDNRAIVTLGTGAVVEGLTLNVDSAFSMEPFADDMNLGTAVVASADTSLEDIADFDAELRWKNDTFQDLYGADAHFDYDADERFATGIPDNGFALNLAVEQQLVDLFDGYVNFDLYDEDWKVKVGGGIDDLLVDGLSGTASFQRLHEAPDEDTDTIAAGAKYDVDPIELGLDFEMVMLEDGREDADGQLQSADEMTFGANGTFAAMEYLDLNASYELVQNLGNYDAADYPFTEDLTKQTIGFGADLVDFEVIENLTLNAGASYEMITGYEFDYTEGSDATDYAASTSEAWDADVLDVNTISANVGLEYVMGKATFGNDFEFTNKTGDAVEDGNLFDNTFSLDYELVEDVDFESSWNERLFRFTDSEEDNWSTREIKAGVSIDF